MKYFESFIKCIFMRMKRFTFFCAKNTTLSLKISIKWEKQLTFELKDFYAHLMVHLALFDKASIAYISIVVNIIHKQ